LNLDKREVYDSWAYFKYLFGNLDKEKIRLEDRLKELKKIMTSSITYPTNEIELYINLGALFLFTKKIEVIFGSRYILISYLITLAVTFLSFIPCNVSTKFKNNDKYFNPNTFNFVFSQIIFMKYRIEYLNSPLLNLAFLSVLLYLILPEGYYNNYETKNVLLSALLTSAIL